MKKAFVQINYQLSRKSLPKLLHKRMTEKPTIYSPQHRINLPTRKINRYQAIYNIKKILCVDINTFNTLHACIGSEPIRHQLINHYY